MIRVVMGLLFEGDGRILIAKRNYSKKYGGLWEFPGGKIERGETIEAALYREIMEELSAPIWIDEVFPGYLFGTGLQEIEFIPVSGTIEPGDIVLNEHEDCRFVSLRQIRQFEFSPADYGAIAMMDDMDWNSKMPPLSGKPERGGLRKHW